MKVPAFDITRQNRLLEEDLDRVFRKTLEHGQFILGEEVERFEAEIARYLGVEYAVGVANGSDALVLALLALEIQPDDEVIVPGFTFFATASAVSRVGAIPVFADVLGDFNIDPADIRRKITPRTRAIIPVHLFGLPAAIEEIMAIAQENNLAVIEDAAQALGSVAGVEPVGTLGDIGCFSFFPTKNLGAFGDGGLVTTNREDLAEKVRMLRVHGSRQKYLHEALGFNSRLDALQAAFLNLKLPSLNGWIAARRGIAQNYREGLEELSDVILPAEDEGHSYNQFTIKVRRRDKLRDFLTQNGIGTTVYYPMALHQQPIFRYLGFREGDLPVCERLPHEVISLPIFPELTEGEQNYVINKIKGFFDK